MRVTRENMNKGLQIATIKRMLGKDNYDLYDVVAYVDSRLTLNENIANFRRRGILKNDDNPSSIFSQFEAFKREFESYYGFSYDDEYLEVEGG